MDNRKWTVGLVQQRCSTDVQETCARAESAIRDAASRGANIICLQELFHAPYFCTTENHEYFSLAQPVPGELTERFQVVAKELEVVLVLPIFERRAPGVYHNSAVVIDADGAILGTYRKMHIPEDPLYYEKFYFTPGDVSDGTSGFRVFQTRYATIGVLICWDQWYPEAARITSLLGAEVLFYPTAIGWHPTEKAQYGEAQREAWRTIQRSHAIANGVYVASVNRVGHEKTPGTDGIEFFGSSVVYDPFGEVIAEASAAEEGTLVAECQATAIETTRQHWPFLRDRRIDAYAPIQSRYLGAK